jgi:murein DD-endopeptidase MepM/ murein hydrolase activator NlpD
LSLSRTTQIGLTLVLLSLACQRSKQISSDSSEAKVESTATESVPQTPRIFVQEALISAESSLYQSLKRFGFKGSDIHRLVQDSKPIFNLGRIPGDTPLQLEFADPGLTEPLRLILKLKPTQSLIITKSTETGGWTASFEDKIISTEPVSFRGLVSSNLWDSAVDAGMPGQVISKLAEIFAWQVDFNREVREGDEWRLTVEKLFVEGQHIGWGNILIGEYSNARESFFGVRFPQTGKALGYFGQDGSNLRKLFLKSPIAFGRITSGFSSARMHPILGVNQPHNGVDYGAPIGTPIFAVGDGTVVEKVYKDTTGNHLRVRHNSVYSTGYSHLKGFAVGLKAGMKVEQGQVIGYVGSTGLSTGPHLHFSFLEHGKHVDPLGLKFPSAEPVPSEKMAEFNRVYQEVIVHLPARFTDAERTEIAQLRWGGSKEASTRLSN